VRILLADDNQDAADTLATLLRLWGHEVRVVYDGLAALEAARDFKPHCALLDIQMPKVNGGDAALCLRRHSELEGIFIVAISAIDPHDPRIARYDGAFDAYLNKPCDLDRLAELLSSIHSKDVCRCRPAACAR
jgi:DNA-binding response OmpR family regulator